MGGRGSGRRRYYGTMDTVEDHRWIDVRRWQRDGYLTPCCHFNWQWMRNGAMVANINVRSDYGHVVLSYYHQKREGEWESVEEPVTLETTPGTYGGHRVWFRCPAVGCGRRVVKLYGAGKYFACRHCYRLAYPSQREDEYDRALRKAQAIRKRLGGSANMLEPFPPKPKGMRWRTYEQLFAEADAAGTRSWMGLAEKLGLLRR